MASKHGCHVCEVSFARICGRSLAELCIMRSSSELFSTWQRVEVNGLLRSFFFFFFLLIAVGYFRGDRTEGRSNPKALPRAQRRLPGTANWFGFSGWSSLTASPLKRVPGRCDIKLAIQKQKQILKSCHLTGSTADLEENWWYHTFRGVCSSRVT